MIPKGAGGKLQELLKKGATKENLEQIQNLISGKPDKPEGSDSIVSDDSTSTDGYPVQYESQSTGMSTNMKLVLAAGGVGVLVLAGLTYIALRK